MTQKQKMENVKPKESGTTCIFELLTKAKKAITKLQRQKVQDTEEWKVKKRVGK
jgi:hypothetical protein